MRHELPKISSVGLPPEIHADRIVAEMLKVIACFRAMSWREMHGIVGTLPDGNPGAQEKVKKRLEKVIGRFLVGIALKSGKRGRYELLLATLEAWNVETNAAIGPEGELPEKPWIALVSTVLKSKGNHNYDQEDRIVLLVTHHALSRLAQRCGARTIDEVYDAVWTIAAQFIAQQFETKAPFRDHDRMRVKLPHDMGVAICAARLDTDNCPVIVTLWKEDEPEEVLP
jgi:hypothetical protein